MDKELLQRQTNIIEGNLINIKGAVMVLPLVPHSAINDMHIYLDKAMYALLEVKRELGLTSQLKETSTTVNATIARDAPESMALGQPILGCNCKRSHDDDVRDELARQLRNERGTDEQ